MLSKSRLLLVPWFPFVKSRAICQSRTQDICGTIWKWRSWILFPLDERQDLWGFISLTFLIWPILIWPVLLQDSLLITTNFIATYFFNKIELIKKFICYVKFHNTMMPINKISTCNELCKFLVSGIALLRNSYPDVYVR